MIMCLPLGNHTGCLGALAGRSTLISQTVHNSRHQQAHTRVAQMRIHRCYSTSAEPLYHGAGVLTGIPVGEGSRIA